MQLMGVEVKVGEEVVTEFVNICGLRVHSHASLKDIQF